MRPDVQPLTPEQVRNLELVRYRFSGFEVFCSGCVEPDGPGCCRTLAAIAANPRRRWWRRLFSRKET
jgi:hypothetical protein